MSETALDQVPNTNKTHQDLLFLMRCFEQILLANNAPDLAAKLPWIHEPATLADTPIHFRKRDVQLYSMAFQLLNLVEINEAIDQRNAQTSHTEQGLVNGLWPQNFQKLKDEGIDLKSCLDLLPEILIEPVLTAHPTEAKRTVVLEHYRILAELMSQRANNSGGIANQNHIEAQIKLALERLWRTGEIYLEKPDVLAEFGNALHYLANIFPKALPITDQSLLQAWQNAGQDPQTLLEARAFPKIAFGNWIGGDRDGHPLVSPQITKYVLDTLRKNAIGLLKNQLIKLEKLLSFAFSLEKTTLDFQERIRIISEQIGPKAIEIINQNKREVFRQFLNLMIEKMPPPDSPPPNLPHYYVQIDELMADLYLLQATLISYGAKAIAYSDVWQLIRQAQTFGFCLARLDIRQNSVYHDKAIGQLIGLSGLQTDDFVNADLNHRLNFLNQELSLARPFTHLNTILPLEAAQTIGALRVVSEFVKLYGSDGIGSFIVSMTRNVSDLLLVYLLAREAGLWVHTDEWGWVCPIEVVPLFETIEDLEHSHLVLDQFVKHPFTKKSIEYRQQTQKTARKCQQVMVGYSDSNKDGGILASVICLYKAQKALSQTALENDIKLEFFHGKGGSISRGSGPTHWFLQALPHGSLQGSIRITEQGETIAQKYANIDNAAYNLELLLAGTLAQTLLYKDVVDTPVLQPILDQLAKNSKSWYTDLVGTADFIAFFGQATPIDAIEQSKMGSRPARRSDKRTLADLRAIPWVFAWSQSRYNLTSWYGVGYALQTLLEQDPAGFEKLKMALKTDGLIRYLLTNIDTGLAATDELVMAQYAELVEDQTIKTAILAKIMDELRRTKQMMALLIERSFEQRRPQHYHSSRLRAMAMKDLHISQIGLLAKWRKQKQDGQQAEAESTLLSILLTINAIAGALRYTG